MTEELPKLDGCRFSPGVGLLDGYSLYPMIIWFPPSISQILGLLIYYYFAASSYFFQTCYTLPEKPKYFRALK